MVIPVQEGKMRGPYQEHADKKCHLNGQPLKAFQVTLYGNMVTNHSRPLNRQTDKQTNRQTGKQATRQKGNKAVLACHTLVHLAPTGTLNHQTRHRTILGS
jgi:hypothetical protein